MRVLLVTSEGACGIAEHSAYLTEAVRAADSSIEIRWHTDLHPASVHPWLAPDIVHLNYHGALHSQWGPHSIREVQSRGIKVIVTYHDTGVPNSPQCHRLHDVADAFIVHEPCDDLPFARYWRQGIPAPPYSFTLQAGLEPPTDRMVVGSVGFPFPWKHFDLLAEASWEAGWGLSLQTPGAKEYQVEHWQKLNPHSTITTTFQDRRSVVEVLTRCDATAFLYDNANTGTSGAIRQGIAARKPLLATPYPMGRQFRDLQLDPLAAKVITWVYPTIDDVAGALRRIRRAPVDDGMVALAIQDGWEHLGRKYAALYHEVLG